MDEPLFNGIMISSIGAMFLYISAMEWNSGHCWSARAWDVLGKTQCWLGQMILFTAWMEAV